MFKYKGEILTEQDLGLWKGPLPTYVEDVKGRPLIHWTGKPIPRNLLSQMKAFLLWTQNEFKGESQIRLYYNERLNHWKAIVLPQYISHGLSTSEVAGHKWRQRAFDTVPATEGWAPCGTIHHHCTAGAFQSGTDVADEKDQHGLHITFGNLDKVGWGFDARVTFNKLFYDIDPAEWFEGDLDEVCIAPHAKETFPRMWKRHMVKKEITKTTNLVVQQNVHSRSYGSSNFGYTGYSQAYRQGGYKMPAEYIDDWYEACKWPVTAREILKAEFRTTADVCQIRMDVMEVASHLANGFDATKQFMDADEDNRKKRILDYLENVVEVMMRLDRGDWGEVPTGTYAFGAKSRKLLAAVDEADKFDMFVEADAGNRDAAIDQMFPERKTHNVKTPTVPSGTCGEDDNMYGHDWF